MMSCNYLIMVFIFDVETLSTFSKDGKQFFYSRARYLFLEKTCKYTKRNNAATLATHTQGLIGANYTDAT